jgi:hypothetical protein
MEPSFCPTVSILLMTKFGKAVKTRYSGFWFRTIRFW